MSDEEQNRGSGGGKKSPGVQENIQKGFRSALSFAANAFQSLKKGISQILEDSERGKRGKNAPKKNAVSRAPKGNAVSNKGNSVPKMENRKSVPKKNAFLREGSENASSGMRILGKTLISYSGVETVVFVPEGIQTICGRAFADNAHVEKVILPTSLWEIGAGAFQNCTALRYVGLPDNEMYNIVESAVFKGCTSLTTVRWSPRIKLIRADSFAGCPLADESKRYFDETFVCSEKRNAYVTRAIANSECYADPDAPYYPPTRPAPKDNSKTESARNADPPRKVRRAFERDPRYPYLYVEDGVLMGIFDDVPVPEELILPASIHEIGVSAFNLAPHIRTIVCRGKLDRVGSCAFGGLLSLESLVFEGPVEIFGENACRECTSLRSVRFGDAVGTLESGAFCGCSALEFVHFGGRLGDMWDDCFRECTSLVQIDIPDTCQNIGRNCFSGCQKLLIIHFPDGLRRIWNGALAHCLSLEEFHWPQGFTIDKHRYPIVDPFVFGGVLFDDYWETFAPKDGVWRRRHVPAMSVDPDGLFDMMIPGTATAVRRIPQVLMNARLNRVWEAASMDEGRYALQMGILSACFTVARAMLAGVADDRAERLFILSRLAVVQAKSTECTEKDLPGILPYALWETLFAICGRGNFRKHHDEILVEEAKRQLGISELGGQPLETLLYKDLRIGPVQRNRYNPWKTQNDIAIDIRTIDYYTFCHDMNILVDAVFDEVLVEPEDPADDPYSREIDAWCLAWNQRIHEELASDVHLVFFHPTDFESGEWIHDAEVQLGFLALLTKSQIQAIRAVLEQYDLDGLMTSYTMELA